MYCLQIKRIKFVLRKREKAIKFRRLQIFIAKFEFLSLFWYRCYPYCDHDAEK